MAIPSGSGTEVLKRLTMHSNGGWNEAFSGTANHIYTILSVIVQERAGAATTLGMRVNDGSNDIFLIGDGTVCPAYGTFVWNDKFVMEGDDDLDIYNTGVDTDWYISYIDQDWT
jgi:hypothetical protein